MIFLIKAYLLVILACLCTGIGILIFGVKKFTLFDLLLVFGVAIGLPFIIPVALIAVILFALEDKTNEIIIYGRNK